MDAVGAKSSTSAARETFERGTFHYVGHFGDGGVRVNVHHLYAPPSHAHFPPCNGSVRLGRLRRARDQLSRQKRSSRSAGYVLDELSAIPHTLLLVVTVPADNFPVPAENPQSQPSAAARFARRDLFRGRADPGRTDIPRASRAADGIRSWSSSNRAARKRSSRGIERQECCAW